MNFYYIFAEYYALFRGDNSVPPVTDPEWAIAVRLANTALRRLEHVDTESWEWLWTTASSGGNVYTYSSPSALPSITTYSGPTDMVKPGGWIKMTDPISGNYLFIDVIASYNVQLQAQGNPYAYWTGDIKNGFVLNISLQGSTYYNYAIDFPYYKSITYFNANTGSNAGVIEDGTTVTECPDSNYIINYILAYRLRATRNYPSYQTAKADAETALQGMQLKNRAGLDGHSWNLNDTSSGSFGTDGYSGYEL
jgi:hypothetical protein